MLSRSNPTRPGWFWWLRMCAALALVLGVALVGSPLRATAEETPSPAPTVTTATPATEEVVTPTAAPTAPEVTEAPAPTTSPTTEAPAPVVKKTASPVPSKTVKTTAKPRAPVATAKTKPTPSKTVAPTVDPKAFTQTLTVRMTAQGIVTVENNSQHVLTKCRVYHDMIDRARLLPAASPDLPGLVEVMAPGYKGKFDFTDRKQFASPVDGDTVYVQCIVPGGTRPTNVGEFTYTAPTSGYGKLYVLCQKVGVEPGWKVVVSQDNDANNQNRFLLAVTEGISPQEARDKYPASKCAKFNQPDDKVTYTQWVDTSSNCETGLVTQTRTVTTTPYVWVAKKHKWVLGTPVVTTETQTRPMTSDEVRSCPVKPDDKVTYTQWVDTSSNCETGLVTQTRTVTTTPYVWVAKKHKWVEGAPVVTTETQTRPMTSDEVRSCPVVPTQPESKTVYTHWVDGAKDCKTVTVKQTRTKTVTSYIWNGSKWVGGTPVVTTETRTRAKTSDEVKACVVVKPTPKPTPNKGPVKGTDVCKNLKGSQASVPKGLVKKGASCVKPTHKSSGPKLPSRVQTDRTNGITLDVDARGITVGVIGVIGVIVITACFGGVDIRRRLD